MTHKPITNGLALIKLLRDKDAPVTRDDTADGVAELVDALEFQTDRDDALEARIEALTEALERVATAKLQWGESLYDQMNRLVKEARAALWPAASTEAAE